MTLFKSGDIAQTKVTIGLSYNTITTTTNKNDLDSNYKDLKINIKRLESDNQVKESLAEKIDHMATSEFKEQNQQLLKLINHPENDTNSQILSSPSRTLNDAVKKTTKDSDNSLFKLKKRQKTEHSIDDLNNNVTNCNEINTIEKSKDLNTSPRNSDRIGSLTKIGPETIESSNDIDTSSKLNTVTNSILVNGKRYYRRNHIYLSHLFIILNQNIEFKKKFFGQVVFEIYYLKSFFHIYFI